MLVIPLIENPADPVAKRQRRDGRVGIAGTSALKLSGLSDRGVATACTGSVAASEAVSAGGVERYE
jgi:hypothetical protein